MRKNKQNMNLDTLIVDMQSKDKKFKNIFKRFQVVFFLFVILYGGLFLVNPDSELTLNHRIAGVCYVLGFSAFTFYLRKYYKIYNKVNYSDPVKKVLEDAEKRYRKFKPDSLIVFTGVLFINAATLLMTIGNIFESRGTLYSFLLVEMLFLGSLGFGLVIGILWWRRDSKPIWLSAKNLLKELEEE
jgi:hypothetical protein